MKTTIKSLLFCALLSSITCNAQWSSKSKIKGNGKIVTEKRTTVPYDEIKIGGSFDVELVAGKEGAITIKGEENLLPLIIVEVEGNILKIYPKKNTNMISGSGKAIIVTVPFESISDVSLGGSGSIISKNTIKANHFSTKLSGSGDIVLTIDANDVIASLSGSGDITLKGKATNYESKLSGSGDISAHELLTTNANASMSGSGNITVNCSNNLIARVSGSGDIDYIGDPKTKDTKVSGSGRISKK
ncbi:DUF2807 domain-containing protein [Flavobacterium sp. F-380]|uniref:DUF2807 domain-containing protein n=1 Tax=Flavobacterium kayseriense TaxID=2764714 RepID=A0ABR7J963_9FLAO|nr:head GIN domain-containing protein [Flavobacterium kayseriense]MBC5841997.1 DUF2807 domain-containing protein [Flavobacterium kayseriense]MBC5848526.1 DUF2807 domain-containing protein [Flavobacterium kayseriense]MBU0941954.1 DUF2807 domain-containing protein [Bacteroidota bacterium]